MLMIATGYASSGQSAIGQWLDHNSFIAVRKVCVGEGEVYAATRMSLFRYDVAENVVKPMTKVNGLTDVGISTMAYNPATQMLAVAYNNSGLDLVHKGQVHHIADIHYSGIGGDKKVYNIRFNGRKVYLATGFGVVVVDADRHEIEETYYLGPDGESGVVYDIAFTDSLVVAATDRGMMTASKGSQRLHIYESWTLDTVSPLAGMSVRMLEVSPWALVAAACTTNPDSMTVFYQYPRTVFYQYAGSWDTLFIGRVRSLKCHNGLVILNRFNRIDIFNDRFECKYSLVELPEYGLAIEDVDVDADGTLWMGHVWAGLIQSPRSYTTFTSHSPVGPTNDDYVYSLTATSSSLYLCPGGKKPTYESALLPGSLSIYEKGIRISMPQMTNRPWDTNPNFRVFTSSTEDQTSLGYDQSQSGLFTYFLATGLQGDADKDGDGIIKLNELVEYVTVNVTTESQKIRGGAQSPQFYGDGNFIIEKIK